MSGGFDMGKIILNKLTVGKDDVGGKVYFDFDIKNGYTVIDSPSGLGKTLFYNLYLSKCINEKRQDTIFINYTDLTNRQGLEDKLKRKNCIYIIDNADIVLTDKMAQAIQKDNNNQYIIFGRDPIKLGIAKDNSARMIKLNDYTFGIKYN